jgi:hypothetical protein
MIVVDEFRGSKHATETAGHLVCLFHEITLAGREPGHSVFQSDFLDFRERDVLVRNFFRRRWLELEEDKVRCAHSCVQRLVHAVADVGTLDYS